MIAIAAACFRLGLHDTSAVKANERIVVMGIWQSCDNVHCSAMTDKVPASIEAVYSYKLRTRSARECEVEVCSSKRAAAAMVRE